MALDRVSFPDGVTGAAGDRANFVALLVQLTQKWNGDPQRFYSDTIPTGAVLQIGGIIYKGTSATSITGTPSDYVKITPAGATASASYVATLSGVTWTEAYNGYYDGSGNLYIINLPAPTVLTSGSGTYTVPMGVRRIRVRAQGPGGNGVAHTSGGGFPDGGGGGVGGYCEKFYNVKPGDTFSYSVGAVGSNTTFSGLTASAAGSASGTSGGSGGSATGGDLNIVGVSGGSGTSSANYGVVGNGGCSQFGGAGQSMGFSAATNTGSGGAGSNSSGGSGAAGIIIIEALS